jgi:plasmid stabilization system protein ParE
MKAMDLARHQVEQAANYHQRVATECNALVGLLKAMRPVNDEPMPVETLARALLPFNLCIVHREVVRNALSVVNDTTDEEGLSGEDLRRLAASLLAALAGSAA